MNTVWSRDETKWFSYVKFVLKSYDFHANLLFWNCFLEIFAIHKRFFVNVHVFGVKKTKNLFSTFFQNQWERVLKKVIKFFWHKNKKRHLANILKQLFSFLSLENELQNVFDHVGVVDDAGLLEWVAHLVATPATGNGLSVCLTTSKKINNILLLSH